MVDTSRLSGWAGDASSRGNQPSGTARPRVKSVQPMLARNTAGTQRSVNAKKIVSSTSTTMPA